MSRPCPSLDSSPYFTGVLPDSGERSSHPGGAALTLRAMHLSGLKAGARILDLGCGTGETLHLLRSVGFEAVGIDPFADDGHKQGALAEDAHRICASAEALPIRDQSIDGILAECSLSVIDHREQVLGECARVLVPGGRLIVSDLYARNPGAIAQVRAVGRSCVAGMIVREELEAQLAAHGFTIELWEDHSQALREFVARFLMYHDSLETLWNCDGAGASAQQIHSAMKAVRAGYFLLIATHRSTKGNEHE